MNWNDIILWGLLATGLLTTLMRGAEGLGYTRMDIPFMLGTMFTSNRDFAKVIGSVVHFLNGFLFSLLYAAFFSGFGFVSWWLGALMGIAHGAFVLIVVLPLLPGVHPRMASEFWGPTPTRLLEPPGFLALHYGYQTPTVTMIAHFAFGLVLGSFYNL
ncbi:MAG: hypothetical protein MPW14_02155 [Candidatus Manganitrophus sp.]|nr:hypothetical protein [Candidatus Manganitrophus sp.]WDT71979.1 MAG: hypothetical protein MPW17_03805 [Candidatus Manganitrophus sp.]WDT75785.1 MAG: hypothetical protein MPW16_00790 [Candidatus Manganitrophus sp.]WDT80618.1 MAG: hypothetical protein MPW14_02155 [Candidatus Manganitrophus sp.]